jgi:hypothetical protein
MGLTTPSRKNKLFRNQIKDAGWKGSQGQTKRALVLQEEEEDIRGKSF